MLEAMTYWQPDGTATGLLAKNKLRSSVDTELPDFMSEIKKVDVNDYRLNAALFRDYSMMSSAYLLEDCHINYLKTGDYGIGMDYLPEKLALPMKFLADRINYKQPLLEYAYGYALHNWKLKNDSNP
jgi:indoleamine 2,3-dioxygenase